LKIDRPASWNRRLQHYTCVLPAGVKVGVLPDRLGWQQISLTE
jgi:hypothetical protein